MNHRNDPRARRPGCPPGALPPTPRSSGPSVARVRPVLIALLLCAFPTSAWAGGDAGGGMTHRMMMLVIQFGLILFAARLGNILFTKIRLPGALGELAAGMIIGPFALGQISLPGFPRGLFPAPQGAVIAVSPELYGLATVASIVLLFHVGLETDLRLLMRYALAGGLVAVGGLVFSFVLGAGAVMVFSKMLFGQALPFHAPPCLFLGTVATATSVGIPARILSDRRKLDSPEGVTILSAAVIDDVLGIVVLAVVTSVVAASRAAGGVDWGHIGVIGAKAVGVWVAATAIGLIASRKISFLLKWFGERTSIAVMALGLALVLAGLFEEAGLAMIIGAYVMGLSLSQADISYVIRERLATVYALLIPVFFCVTGMQIDLAALASPAVLAFGLVYAVAALASKVFGCGLPALLANFNLRGAARVGFGMAPRCEVALIIAGIALGAGWLTPGLFAAVIVMVLVNTLVAPPALVWLFRGDRTGTRKAVDLREKKTVVRFDFPAPEMLDFFTGKLTDVFEAEGFYVHQFGREPSIYQIRKDRTVIDFTCRGTELEFSCDPPEVALVNTAVYEALAGLEDAIRGLRQPLDTTEIRSRIQDTGPLGPPTLNLKQYLTPQLVVPHLRARTKEQVIDELLDRLARHGLVRDREAARQAVLEREASMSTGLQYGVAIPHGRTDAVGRLVCAVGVKPEGVDFEAIDGEPSRIFVLTLSPKRKPAPHVQFMSTVSQVLNETGRKRILATDGAEEIYRVFTTPPQELAAAPAPSKPAVPPPTGPFHLRQYLRPEAVEPQLKAGTKESAIVELLELLNAARLLADVRPAADAVLAREAQMATGMGEGVAIPHGRTNAVEHLRCAVGISRGGIDFGAVDGKPARIVILVLTPEGGADPYLQFVGSLMSALDDEGREQALAAGSREELYRLLTRES